MFITPIKETSLNHKNQTSPFLFLTTFLSQMPSSCEALVYPCFMVAAESLPASHFNENQAA